VPPRKHRVRVRERMTIIAKYLFIKGVLHFYILKDRHDDFFVRTILRQRRDFFGSFPSSTFPAHDESRP